MSRVKFEPKIPVVEQAKTVHALDSVTTVIDDKVHIEFQILNR
jgi:hypothetical protein